MPWSMDRQTFTDPSTLKRYSRAEYEAIKAQAQASGATLNQLPPWVQSAADGAGGGQASGNPFSVQGGDQQLGESLANTASGGLTKFGYAPQQIDDNAPGAHVDTTYADAERARTQALLERLQQQAATGDGAWQDQLAQATQLAGADAQAVGQSQPGAGYGASLRHIGNARAGVQQRAVGQGNILREQSKVDAQNQMAQLLGGQGDLDIGQAEAKNKANAGVNQLRTTLQNNADQNIAGGVKAAADIIFSDGGEVPGRAEVFGDDSRNDTVPAWLSPGEIVIPRSHAQSPESAASFVAALQARRPQHFAGGGDVDLTGGTGIRDYGGVPFKNWGSTGEAPSVENGGMLDMGDFNKNRSDRSAVSDMFAQRAAGQGPSTAPQRLQDARDANLLAAMSGRAGAEAVGAAQQRAAGNSAEVAAGEQGAGQKSMIQWALENRARELAAAQAQQQAEWRKTLENAGVGLEQQQLLRNLASGAGQAATSFALADDGGPSFDSPQNTPSYDYGTAPQGAPSTPDEWANPYAQGGEVRASKERLAHTHLDDRRAPTTLEVLFAPVDQSAAGTGAPLPLKPATFRGTGKEDYEPLRDLEVSRAGGGYIPGYADGGLPSLNVDDVTQSDPSSIAAALRGATYGLPSDQTTQGAQVVNGPAITPRMASMAGAAVGPTLDMAALERAKRGEYPTNGPQADQAHRIALGDMAKTTTARDAAAALGIRPPAEAPPPAQPVKPPPAAAQPKPVAAKPAGPLPGVVDEQHATDEGRAAIEAEGRIKSEQARQEAAALGQYQTQLEANALQRSQIDAAAKQRTDEMLGRYKEAQEALRNVSTTVDPNRAYASQTTPQKILGAIGLALGALGAGRDGINRSAAMIERAIERDIAIQQADIASRLKKGQLSVEGADRALAMSHQIWQNDVSANAAAKASMLDLANNQLARIAASTKDPLSKAQAAQLSAELLAKQGKFQSDAANIANDNNREWYMAKTARDAAMMKQPPGNAEVTKTVNEVSDRASLLRSNVAKAQAIIDKSGTFELTGGAQEELARILNDIATDSAKLKDPSSVARPTEVEGEKKSLGVEAGALLTSNATAKKLLNSFLASVDEREQTAYKVRGLTPPSKSK